MRLPTILSAILVAATSLHAADLVLAEMESDLVPNSVPYAVLFPDGYKDSKPLPLLIMLRGGGGSRDMLASFKPMFEQLWQSGSLSKMIVTAPSTTSRGFYMDRREWQREMGRASSWDPTASSWKRPTTPALIQRNIS